MHPDPTWIVVADDRAARFFLRSHWGDPIEELPELAESADFLDRRHAGTRTEATPPVQAAVRQTAKHDEDEKSFLHRVAKEIDELMISHSAQGLVLCAPPRVLSLLRDYVSAHTRARLCCEITRDFVQEKAASIDAAMRHLKV
jgi:protein required for attachment to host cells